MIRLAATSLFSRDPSLAESAATRLTQLAASHPLEVMRSFGANHVPAFACTSAEVG